MADPKRWHTEVRGRTEAELRDRLATTERDAAVKSWRLVERGDPRQEGDETVWPLVYEHAQYGPKPWFVGLLLALVGVLVVLTYVNQVRW